VGIDGFDAFRLELESAPGVRGEQPVLQRTPQGAEARTVRVVSVQPGTRIGLYLILTDRQIYAMSIIASKHDFDAFMTAAERVIASFDFRG
jgi:hypothetical protein